MTVRALAVTAILSIAFALPAAYAQPSGGPAVTLSSVPSNVVRGEIPANVPPVLRVKQGQHVTIDTLSHQGGATLFLPVYNPGALFFTGDAHAAQGDGEVDGTAIEASLKPTFQFIVHKGRGTSLTWPRAETPTHYIAMGMDKDLNLAMKAATQ